MSRYTDRRSVLRGATIGASTLATGAIAAPALAQTAPDVKWRMTTSWPKSLDTLYGGCEFMARRVAELSDNKFHLQVFAAGEIVPGLQALDTVQTGATCRSA
jgi:TRAP-type mannitol/chloroaromatic compound transport system substrate-binding protein